MNPGYVYRGSGDESPPDLDEEEPRAQREGVCGVTRLVGSTEFVCIARVHDDPPRPGHGQRSQRRQLGYYPKSERHYMVNRWPNRADRDRLRAASP